MKDGTVNVSYKPDGAWLNINPRKGAKCSLNVRQLSSKFNGIVRRSLLDLCQEPEQTETDLTKLDKSFGELDRATQLKLVEHVLDGGRVDKLRVDGEWSKGVPTGILSLHPLTVYRTIQS